MKYEYETLGEIKQKIVERGKSDEFERTLSNLNLPEIREVFSWVKPNCMASAYAIDDDGHLISYKNKKQGQPISNTAFKKRAFDVGLGRATGKEILILINTMNQFIHSLPPETSERVVKEPKEKDSKGGSFDSVIITHTDMAEFMEFDLTQTSLQDAINDFRDEYDVNSYDVENIRVIFFNKRNAHKVSISYKLQ